MANLRGFNQFSGVGGKRGSDGFGLFFDSKALENLARDAAGRFSRNAQGALQVVHEELARDVAEEALLVLRREVGAHGRPQRELRGEPRYLEDFLANTIPREFAQIRVGGFTAPDPAALNRSKARRYWRQVERGATTTQELTGLFGLPPLVGGRVASGQFDLPQKKFKEGGGTAVKFAQFTGSHSRTITARVGPKQGYHYLEEGGRNAIRKWRQGRAKRLYLREFKAVGLPFKGTGGELFIS